MSIANEIQRLQNAKADIKSAIENKGVTVGDGTIDTYAEKISEISGGGGVDYSPFLTQARFYSMNDFGKSELELNLQRLTELGSLFYEGESGSVEARVNKTVEHLTINSGEITSMYCSFSTSNYKDTTLKRLTLNIDTSKCTGFYQSFRGRNALEIIDGTPLDFTSVTSANNTFLSCDNLAEIRFVPNTIKVGFSFASSANLSAESIQSIINGLADLTGGTAKELTLHATVGNKLTDTQKATITAKNWTLVY